MNNLLFEFNSLCVVLWLLILVLILLYLFGRFYFFKKIGIDGWKGLIPVYSNYLYFEKGNENPKLPVILFFSYLFLVIYDEYFISFSEMHSILLFFKSLIVIISIIVSWNVNFYISNKMKNNYLLTFFLTFFPIITVPVVGLSQRFKWSRLYKINNNFLLNDFYSNRKITIVDVLISNFVSSILNILLFYVIFFVFKSFFSIDKIVENMWNSNIVLILILIVFILATLATTIDYLINKYKFIKRR